jgi:sugar lactone lactonase YvrE
MPQEQFPQNSTLPSATLVLDVRDIIVESIVCDDRRNVLLWVEIGGKRIHRLALGERSHEIWPAPGFPTSIGLRKDGGAIVGLTTRVALWNYDKVFEIFAVPAPDVPSCSPCLVLKGQSVCKTRGYSKPLPDDFCGQ